MRALVILVLCVTRILTLQALDVKFTPSDANPDASLPLSKNYRDGLRKLCKMMKSGKPLPPDMKDKRASLKTMCAKLAKDDANVAGVSSSTLIQRTLVIGLVGVGGAFVVWQNAHAIISFLKLKFAQLRRSGVHGGAGSRGHRLGGTATETTFDAQLAREMRLKRFAVTSVDLVERVVDEVEDSLNE